ncbi:unnamed protein product [Protopolystoma xenopodis]|uniref:Uncharacterized protein n=1 Tax=Protopolystoma xenopodis TaxID=117903 RepID=A0A3S5AQQ7_9PLAT|nr:unnamed protein product [Protopolystoma xenopodis]
METFETGGLNGSKFSCGETSAAAFLQKSAFSAPRDAPCQTYPHPVAGLLSSGLHQQAALGERLRAARAVQGLHLPLRLCIEQRLLHRIPTRLPGLHAANPLAAQLAGDLDDIDLADFITRELRFLFLERNFCS